MKRTLTVADFRKWGACFEPTEKIPESWSGDFLTFIKEEKLSFTDKVWALARLEIMEEVEIRKFIHYMLKEIKSELIDEDVDKQLTGKKKDFRELYKKQSLKLAAATDPKEIEIYRILMHAFNPRGAQAANGVAHGVQARIDQKKALETLEKMASTDGG